MSEGKVVLGYWAIRGLAQFIRHLLQYTGVSYQQVFYIEKDEDLWFKGDKPKYLEKNPAVNLPYLIDGDTIVSESAAIAIYICHRSKKVELLGRNPQQQVQLATVYGIFKDLQPQYSKLVYGGYTEPSWEEALSVYSKSFEGYIKKFSGLLGHNKFICGELTWIDFLVANMFQVLNKLNPSIFAHHQNLIEYQKRVWSLPELQNYFKSDRWHEHPINGDEAKWR